MDDLCIVVDYIACELQLALPYARTTLNEKKILFLVFSDYFLLLFSDHINKKFINIFAFLGISDHLTVGLGLNEGNSSSPTQKSIFSSLSRTVLSLDSSATQQAALQHILNALQVNV